MAKLAQTVFKASVLGSVDPGSSLAVKAIKKELQPDAVAAPAIRKVDTPVGAYSDIAKRRGASTMAGRGRANSILSSDSGTEKLG